MAREPEQILGMVDRRLDAAAAEHVGIVEGVDEIDDDQRRLLAQPDTVAETLLFVNVEVVRHDTLPAAMRRPEISRGSCDRQGADSAQDGIVRPTAG